VSPQGLYERDPEGLSALKAMPLGVVKGGTGNGLHATVLVSPAPLSCIPQGCASCGGSAIVSKRLDLRRVVGTKPDWLLHMYHPAVRVSV
jgi:hypothetical protein